MKTPFTFNAALTPRQIKKAEALHQGWQPIRRAALFVLSRDSIDLAEALQYEPKAEALLELAQHIDEFLKWRAHETEMLTAAHARLWYVLGEEADRILAGSAVEPDGELMDAASDSVSLVLDLSEAEAALLAQIAEREGSDPDATAASLLSAAIRQHAESVSGGAA
ncbi:hypothetical protein [Thiobaca trueperi]|uniref:Uncharacterized protein n=1 Tax=Thiobaca trueperi TaxID=127458 RepID=A0A4R3MUW3_9GAMM|nr:hypothetical protein [Thiobaca trueperi]TCT20278.1 hypothetical protein EDC35_106205 [Thiobaca trueperi]